MTKLAQKCCRQGGYLNVIVMLDEPFKDYNYLLVTIAGKLAVQVYCPHFTNQGTRGEREKIIYLNFWKRESG